MGAQAGKDRWAGRLEVGSQGHQPTRLDVPVQDAVGVALCQGVQHAAHISRHLQGSGGASIAQHLNGGGNTC